MVTGLWEMVAYQVRMRLREPVAVFFDILWAPLMLLFFGTIFSARAETPMPGVRQVDLMAPQMMILAVLVIGFLDMTPWVAQERELGFLRRLKVTPMPPWVYFGGLAVASLLITGLGILLILLVGMLLFGLTLHGSPMAVLLALGLAVWGIYPLGFLLASVSITPALARATGFIVGFPMMFLSGAAGVPVELFPQGLRAVASYLPATIGVKVLQGAWLGQNLGPYQGEILYLILFGLSTALLSVRLFRWEAKGEKL